LSDLSQRIIAAVLDDMPCKGFLSAGIAALELLKKAPAYAACDAVAWPSNAKSVLVLALGHAPEEPWLDWWDSRAYGTPGNRQLVRISKQVKQLIKRRWGIGARPLHYHVEKGGVFLKDAAVLAGLGIIGENNLLVTPRLGPRVRLRALFLDKTLVQTGPIRFDPCRGCPRPCQAACPQNAFAEGRYSRRHCSKQMAADATAVQANPHPGSGRVSIPVIQYCRACELACVVGKSRVSQVDS
jgi:epoxyqueuosine reductase